MPKSILFFKEVHNCAECPASTKDRTMGAGYAFDYRCSLSLDKNGKGRIGLGYVEYQSDIDRATIPNWCPFNK